MHRCRIPDKGVCGREKVQTHQNFIVIAQTYVSTLFTCLFVVQLYTLRGEARRRGSAFNDSMICAARDSCVTAVVVTSAQIH